MSYLGAGGNHLQRGPGVALKHEFKKGVRVQLIIYTRFVNLLIILLRVSFIR